jgi:putative colanic acid biosynthesis acetyltransferase WcaF
MTNRLRTMRQKDWGTSPWSLSDRIRGAVWRIAWAILFLPTPKPCNAWRVALLKVFGCRVSGQPFVASSARIEKPWYLTLKDKACLGPRSEVYNLGPVTLLARSTVAQQVYLCAGTHDLSDPKLPLVVGPIVIGEDVFIGARALVLPGVTIGTGAVIGAGAVVTKDMPEWMVCAGNPCRPIKERLFEGRPAPV